MRLGPFCCVCFLRVPFQLGLKASQPKTIILEVSLFSNSEEKVACCPQSSHGQGRTSLALRVVWLEPLRLNCGLWLVSAIIRREEVQGLTIGDLVGKTDGFPW